MVVPRVVLVAAAVAVALSKSSVTVESALSAEDRRHLDAVVQAAMDHGSIPGLALSIVSRTSPLVEKGYGVTNVSSGRRIMDADTLVAIGSITKAFTSALLAILIEKHASKETRFNWTTPVRDLLRSSFALYDDELTQRTTLEDILSHRTGIPDYFLLLLAGYPYNITRQQLVHSLRYHKPVLPFRGNTTYMYNNHLYALAGYVAEVLEGTTWERLTRQYLLQPLGMTSTTFVSDVLMTSPDKMAASCAWNHGRCDPVDLQVLDQVNVASPAGAIVSSARDMSLWMQWHLAGGAVPVAPGSSTAGRRLISREGLWETHRERNRALSVSMADMGGDRHVAYDLGWITSYYRDERRVWHSGSISTYKSQIWLYPDAGVGIFTAVSGPQRHDTTSILRQLMHQISDLAVFRIRPNISLSARENKTESETETPADFPALLGRALNVSAPPWPLVDYIGVYFGRWQQNRVMLTLAADNASLLLQLGRMLTAELRHYDCSRDEFIGTIVGRLWWMSEGLPLQAAIPVRFLSSTGSSSDRPDVLEMPLEMSAWWVRARRSRFTRRGVDLPGNWRPQGDHGTCSEAPAPTSANQWLTCLGLGLVVELLTRAVSNSLRQRIRKQYEY